MQRNFGAPPTYKPDVIAIYVICAGTADYPGKFVVRRHEAHRSSPDPVVTSEVYLFDTLGDARRMLARRGLVPIDRDPRDNPVIVESWL